MFELENLEAELAAARSNAELTLEGAQRYADNAGIHHQMMLAYNLNAMYIHQLETDIERLKHDR